MRKGKKWNAGGTNCIREMSSRSSPCPNRVPSTPHHVYIFSRICSYARRDLLETVEREVCVTREETMASGAPKHALCIVLNACACCILREDHSHVAVLLQHIMHSCVSFPAVALCCAHMYLYIPLLNAKASANLHL